MPRPDYIARLHAAKYDLRFCEGRQKVEMLRRYREMLAEAARHSGISESLLEAGGRARLWRMGEAGAPSKTAARLIEERG